MLLDSEYVYADYVRQDILRMVPKDGLTIGSIGCGYGATEAVLVREGRQIHGVDVLSNRYRHGKTTVNLRTRDRCVRFPPIRGRLSRWLDIGRCARASSQCMAEAPIAGFHGKKRRMGRD